MESEKQAFNRSKSSAKFKVQDYTEMLQSTQSPFEPDEYRLGKLAATPTKAFRRNNRKSVLLDGLPPNANPKQIGTKLNQIADKARTAGRYEEKSKLVWFTLLVKTEISEKEGADIRVNRFLVQGEGNIKYTYNNGIMAKDPETAAMNFLRAFRKAVGALLSRSRRKFLKYKKTCPYFRKWLTVRGLRKAD